MSYVRLRGQRVRYEQALARLFAKTGWSQVELAKKEGCTQKTVSRKLTFGAFLENIPAGINSESPIFNLLANLSELDLGKDAFASPHKIAEEIAGPEYCFHVSQTLLSIVPEDVIGVLMTREELYERVPGLNPNRRRSGKQRDQVGLM